MGGKLPIRLLHQGQPFLDILWQSEKLARPSVILPLHAGLFISGCFPITSPISGVSIKTIHSYDLLKAHYEPQLPTLLNPSDYGKSKSIMTESRSALYYFLLGSAGKI